MQRKQKDFSEPEFKILKLAVSDVITSSEETGGSGDNWWLPEG